MFLCLDGAIALKAGDEQVELAPGDFLFVPRGTPHAYQFLRPYTRMIGWLIPGIFEDFFHTLGEPYAGKVYPQEPGPLRFDRILARLDDFDIIPLGGPPPGTKT
jgi:quercetin 2,3-dioxygenase